MSRNRTMPSTIGVLVITFFLNACASKPIPTPTPVPPPLVGHLIVSETGTDGTAYYDINRVSGTTKVDKLAGPGSGEFSISPDGRYFLYSLKKIWESDTSYTTVLYDRTTGQSKILFPYRTNGFEWNMDSSAFSYFTDFTDHALYVYDLSTNSTTLIDKAPSATYAEKPGWPSVRFFAAQTGGKWFSGNQLLFGRRTGGMPSSISTGKFGEMGVLADTATVATIDKTPMLENLRFEWRIVDFCPAQSSVLLSKDKQRDLFVVASAQSFRDWDNITELHSINTILNGEPHFVPNSCEIFLGDGRILDPSTFEERDRLKLPRNFGEWVWVGDPKDKVFALYERIDRQPDDVRTVTSQIIFNLTIFDLKTGGRLVIPEGSEITTYPGNNVRGRMFTLKKWIP